MWGSKNKTDKTFSQSTTHLPLDLTEVGNGVML